MSLHIEDESIITLSLEVQEIAEKVIEMVLEYEECPYQTEVNLVLTSDNEIAKMNKQFRGIDRATDVLSFPNVDFKSPSDFEGLEEEIVDNFNPETGELVLGDIVICTEKVLAQAEEYGHSLTREYAFLIAHSMLHLLGYDHMEIEEANEMEAKQEEVLKRLDIKR
jgi:metalloprotein, YbeY/UPF0054 family